MGIADTGFLVAFANARDVHHDWAVSVARRVSHISSSSWSKTRVLMDTFRRLVEALDASPTPASEWRGVNRVLGGDVLAQLLGSRSPAQLLSGTWRPEDPGPQRVRDLAPERPALPLEVSTGAPGTYESCQSEARRLRAQGATAMTAPSAALLPGAASGWRVDGGLRPGPARDGRVFVLYGSRPDLVGWAATVAGRPGSELLPHVRHF